MGSHGRLVVQRDHSAWSFTTSSCQLSFNRWRYGPVVIRHGNRQSAIDRWWSSIWWDNPASHDLWVPCWTQEFSMIFQCQICLPWGKISVMHRNSSSLWGTWVSWCKGMRGIGEWFGFSGWWKEVTHPHPPCYIYIFIYLDLDYDDDDDEDDADGDVDVDMKVNWKDYPIYYGK